jgi:16S rRNA (cytidine1402-2'-O)-methyltransferase
VGRLYIVSTPIGNLGDITYRAVEVLGRVDRVLAEDTRRTSILFRRYGIRTPLVSAHAHNEEARAAALLEWLAAGQEVALVSDAGTPLLSDPGARIVRAALEAGHDVVPVPGASALLASLVASGVEAATFTFVGFPPRAGGERKRWVAAVAGSGHATVMYESPNRLQRLLADLFAAAGGERRVAVGRELTKLHEVFFRGTLEEAVAYYADRALRGEVVVVLSGAGPSVRPDTFRMETPEAVARQLVAEGRAPTAVARELARRLGLTRSQAYPIARAAAAVHEGESD